MSSILVRPRRGKIIAGVCAGLADRFGISRGLVRLLFVIFGIVAGMLAAKWLKAGPPTPDMAIEQAKITRETLEAHPAQAQPAQEIPKP